MHNNWYSTNISKAKVYIAISLLSFGMILYEIVLARLFSVILSYHFVFAVLSLAILGLGTGGLLLKKLLKTPLPALLAILAAITALVSGITTAAILFFSQAALPFLGGVANLVIVLLPVVPFLFFGMVIAGLFQLSPNRSSLLYGFDITGGALAALAAIPVLNTVSAITAAFAVVFVIVLAAFLLIPNPEIKWRVVLLSTAAVLFATGGIWFSPQNILPLKNNQNKDLNRLLYGSASPTNIIETRWSAFGQTSLVENDILPGEKMIYVDGAAGTSMFSFNALLEDSTLRNSITSDFGQFFPFYFLNDSEKDRVLIVGPGGGRDVLVALLGGAKNITAVEVNPDLVDIVKEYEEYNGGLYTQFPNVEVIVEEGRHFIRNTSTTFDLIMLALPVTKSSRSVDGYALTENYLFTVNAFSDYLNRLAPQGRIIFLTHGNTELHRLLILVLKAFNQQGISNKQAMNHLYVVSKNAMPALIIKKTPFEPEQIQLRHASLHQLGYDQGNYFMPYQNQASYLLPLQEDSTVQIEWNMFDKSFYDLSEGLITAEDFIKNYPLNISPVYDDNPFFYNFDRQLPPPFPQFFGLIVLGIVVAIFPLSVSKPPHQVRLKFIKPFARHPQLKMFLVVFMLLGVGFMALEISLFQKLMLYLGNPVLTTSVLLFSLLLGVGTGSLCSARIKKSYAWVILGSGVVVAVLSIAYTNLLNLLMDLPVSTPSLTAGLMTGILGFFLGIPFPLTIRLMAEKGLAQYTSAMWGVNGLASVAGSIIAMIIGLEWGFSKALTFSAIIYLLIALLVIKLSAKNIN